MRALCDFCEGCSGDSVNFIGVISGDDGKEERFSVTIFCCYTCRVIFKRLEGFEKEGYVN